MWNKVEAVKKVDFFIASIWYLIKLRQCFLCVLAVNAKYIIFCFCISLCRLPQSPEL